MRNTDQNLHAKGSTLVAVFWLISILGLALFSTMTLLKFESDMVSAQTSGTRARHFAEMGLAVAANRVIERDDPLLQYVTEGGNEGYSVQITSEADKFDLNLLVQKGEGNSGEESPQFLADKIWLRELFVDWGMELEDAQDFVDALVDWVDQNDLEELNGAERPYYEQMGYIDRPFNRPFYNLDEVRFVRGAALLEQINPNWQDWFTVWTRSGVDLLEADAEIIAAALEISIDDADYVTEMVRGADGLRGTEDDIDEGGYTPSVEELVGGIMPVDRLELVGHRVSTGSQVEKLISTGWSGDIKRQLTLIIQNRQQGQPQLLERREEIVE